MSYTHDVGQLPHPDAPPPGSSGEDPTRSSQRLLVVGVVMLSLSIIFLLVALVFTRGRTSDEQSIDTTDDTTTSVPIEEDSSQQSSDRDGSPESDPTATVADTVGDTTGDTTRAPSTESPAPTLPPTATSPASPPTAPASPVSSQPRSATVVRSCGSSGRGDCFVSVRSGPTSSAPELSRLYEGTTTEVLCTVYGSSATSSILGRSTDVWAKDPAGRYMSMAFLDVLGWDLYTTTVPC